MSREIRDIAVSAAVLAAVFAYDGIGKLSTFPQLFLMSLVAVSLGFVLHEMAHRQVAKKYHYHAEYRLWPHGLLLAVLIAVATNGSFVFAAPGAVMMQPIAGLRHAVTRKAMGMVSLAGPLTNIAIAGAFAAAGIFFPHAIFGMGARINIFLALFNLLPLPPLDGSKVFAWDSKAWAIVFAAAVAMLFA